MLRLLSFVPLNDSKTQQTVEERVANNRTRSRLQLCHTPANNLHRSSGQPARAARVAAEALVRGCACVALLNASH